MGGSAHLAAAGPRDAGVSDPAAVTAAGKAAAVTIEFLEDGRCATSSAGQGFKSSTTYRPKGEQAGERRCAMPPVRPGTNVNLTVRWPRGAADPGASAPALRWQSDAEGWTGSAVLTTWPEVIVVQEDRPVWMFWAAACAGVVLAGLALRRRRAGRSVPA